MRRAAPLLALLAICAACSGPAASRPTAGPAPTPELAITPAPAATERPAPAADAGAPTPEPAAATPTAAPQPGADTPAATPEPASAAATGTVSVALPGVQVDPYPAPAPAGAATATPSPASVIALPGISGAPPANESEATVVPDAVIPASVGGAALQLQVVADPEKRARGLMFYRSLPDDQGMLFVFPTDGQLNFWMRNTLIPLSVAYLDSAGRILNIEDMQPLDEQTAHPSAGPARYALEVNQGWFAARGVGPGAVVEFTLPADLVVR